MLKKQESEAWKDWEKKERKKFMAKCTVECI